MKPSNKIEDQFFGKRVVKKIFAKAKFEEPKFKVGQKVVGLGSQHSGLIGKIVEVSKKPKIDKDGISAGYIFTVQFNGEMTYKMDQSRLKAANSRAGFKAKFGQSEKVTTLVGWLDNAISALKNNNIKEADLQISSVQGNLFGGIKWNSTTSKFNDGLNFAKSMMRKDVEGAILYIKQIQNKLKLTPDDAFKYSRAGAKAKFATRYGLPEFTKQKILDMIKTGKYESIYDVKEGLVELRNNVTKKIVRVYCAG